MEQVQKRKKPAGQKKFEKERARVGQILLDRGEELPAGGITVEWLKNWYDREAVQNVRAAAMSHVLAVRGEQAPEGEYPLAHNALKYELTLTLNQADSQMPGWRHGTRTKRARGVRTNRRSSPTVSTLHSAMHWNIH
jgi:hypothetical protein